MEGNAQAKFQDQRNVIWFTNYLLIYFQSVNWIEYESVLLLLFSCFYILQVMTVCMYYSPGLMIEIIRHATEYQVERCFSVYIFLYQYAYLMQPA